MPRVLADHNRRAAHGLHVCWPCRRRIASGEIYQDQRIADAGTVYTVRSHLVCADAYASWEPDCGIHLPLVVMSEGHLPPCRLAWDGVPEDTTCTCEERDQ